MFTSEIRRTVSAIAAIILFCAPISSLAQSVGPTDFLGIPGPIEFNGVQHHLAWSSRPSNDYIKHEYIPQDQELATYTQMVIVELVTSGLSTLDAVNAQMKMLDRRKESDPLVNYQLLTAPKNHQVLLDFLLSDQSTGTLIVEWNAYRYIPVMLPDGGKAIVLYAISRRHYGSGAEQFLKTLKSSRASDIDALAKFKLPGADLSGIVAD